MVSKVLGYMKVLKVLLELKDHVVVMIHSQLRVELEYNNLHVKVVMMSFHVKMVSFHEKVVSYEMEENYSYVGLHVLKTTMKISIIFLSTFAKILNNVT